MSKDVLSRSGIEILSRFVDEQTAFAFDYDGTLAPLVADPVRAHMRKRTRELLAQLVNQRPTIILTGRAVASALLLTAPLKLALIIGNHGAEWSNKEHDVGKLDAEWRRALGEKLRAFPGAFYEDKGHSVSVHVRHVEDPAHRRAISSLVRAQTHLRLVRGKQVYNLMPKGSLDKGTALIAARRELGLDRIVFFGDDVTDEDVFRLEMPWLFSVRVGIRRSSEAEFHIGAQTDIDALLAFLVQATRKKYVSRNSAKWLAR